MTLRPDLMSKTDSQEDGDGQEGSSPSKSKEQEYDDDQRSSDDDEESWDPQKENGHWSSAENYQFDHDWDYSHEYDESEFDDYAENEYNRHRERHWDRDNHENDGDWNESNISDWGRYDESEWEESEYPCFDGEYDGQHGNPHYGEHTGNSECDSKDKTRRTKSNTKQPPTTSSRSRGFCCRLCCGTSRRLFVCCGCCGLFIALGLPICIAFIYSYFPRHSVVPIGIPLNKMLVATFTGGNVMSIPNLHVPYLTDQVYIPYKMHTKIPVTMSIAVADPSYSEENTKISTTTGKPAKVKKANNSSDQDEDDDEDEAREKARKAAEEEKKKRENEVFDEINTKSEGDSGGAPPHTKLDVPLHTKEVTLLALDSAKIKAWLVRSELHKILEKDSDEKQHFKNINVADGVRNRIKRNADKVVLIVHGHGSGSFVSIEFDKDSVMFNKVGLPLLQAGFQVMLVDLRSHGASAFVPPLSTGYFEQLDILACLDYLEVVEGFDLERQVAIYGFSMGAATSLMSIGRNGIDIRRNNDAVKMQLVRHSSVLGGTVFDEVFKEENQNIVSAEGDFSLQEGTIENEIDDVDEKLENEKSENDDEIDGRGIDGRGDETERRDDEDERGDEDNENTSTWKANSTKSKKSDEKSTIKSERAITSAEKETEERKKKAKRFEKLLDPVEKMVSKLDPVLQQFRINSRKDFTRRYKKDIRKMRTGNVMPSNPSGVVSNHDRFGYYSSASYSFGYSYYHGNGWNEGDRYKIEQIKKKVIPREERMKQSKNSDLESLKYITLGDKIEYHAPIYDKNSDTNFYEHPNIESYTYHDHQDLLNERTEKYIRRRISDLEDSEKRTDAQKLYFAADPKDYLKLPRILCIESSYADARSMSNFYFSRIGQGYFNVPKAWSDSILKWGEWLTGISHSKPMKKMRLRSPAISAQSFFKLKFNKAIDVYESLDIVETRRKHQEKHATHNIPERPKHVHKEGRHVLQIHGIKDSVVSYSQALQLNKKFNKSLKENGEKKPDSSYLFMPHDGEHQSGYIHMQGYLQTIIGFIERGFD